MKFIRGIDPKRAMGIGETVLEKLERHPVCRILNDITIKVNDPRDLSTVVWVNPDNQYCFNHGNFSLSELYDWMEGTGPVVKGKTEEEKKKYWDLAVFEADDSGPGPSWSIKYMWKWFDKFQTDFDHKNATSSGTFYTQIEKPLRVKSPRTGDEKENIRRQEEVILAMFVPFVDDILHDLEYREWNAIMREYTNIFYGIKRTLFCMGIGYMAASNTPEDLLNLSYINDIIWAKSIYIFHKNKGTKLPDFEFFNKKNKNYD